VRSCRGSRLAATGALGRRIDELTRRHLLHRCGAVAGAFSAVALAPLGLGMLVRVRIGVRRLVAWLMQLIGLRLVRVRGLVMGLLGSLLSLGTVRDALESCAGTFPTTSPAAATAAA